MIVAVATLIGLIGCIGGCCGWCWCFGRVPSVVGRCELCHDGLQSSGGVDSGVGVAFTELLVGFEEIPPPIVLDCDVEIGKEHPDKECHFKVKAKGFSSLDGDLEMLEVGWNLLSPIELEGEDCDAQVQHILVFQVDGSISDGLKECLDCVFIYGLGGPVDIFEDLIGDG